MTKNIIDQVLSSSPNRRSLLKKIGVAGAALTAAGATGVMAATTVTPEDVVQFALNLEYLEAEFYSVATTGKTIEANGQDVSGTGNGGATTTSYGAVNFSNNLLFTGSVAKNIALDELNHVKDLRAALMGNGITPVAKPAINLDALASLGASLQNEGAFLQLARIFEDIGVSAYSGAAPLLSGSAYLGAAARILAVEGEHVGNIRLQVAKFGLTSPKLDGADVPPPPATGNFFSTNTANGLCAIRTPGQVLYLAYGNKANATSGGFFPNGVNGAVNMSTSAAPASNLS